ncbi:MAG: ribonuclease HII [Gloeomargaritaceae cyanobacterium C42_A2020_066]|nr:ribonuclease HII [Gloeomargaritaceae cyanobacterium C42_A2020_066]
MGRKYSSRRLSPSAGVDEAGRGALFGPVVAAAVLVTPDQAQVLARMGVRDSKQLTAGRRQALVNPIQASVQSWAVAAVSAVDIDARNILQATLQAMTLAVQRLSHPPHLCLIDGNQRIPHLDVPQRTLVGGDQQEVSIAAASILAKVWRDTWILERAQDYPVYHLAANKGYGTAVHRRALLVYGPTAEHRLSFRPCQVSQTRASASGRLASSVMDCTHCR